MTAPPVPVLLDVDTGVDDAMAILLAVRHPAVDVLGLTCVSGNVAVDQVVRNTLQVLDAAGAPDLPVARGADRPLLEPPREARHVHGEDGLGDLGLPASARAVDPRHAVQLLHDLVSGCPRPVTLVALAPLTNVALLLRTFPEVVGNLRRIVVMGGSAGRGNATASAEFNVLADPEAAAVVLGAGTAVTMYGLDVFYRPTVPEPDVDRLVASADRGARLAGQLLRHQAQRFGPEGAILGDAGAVATVVDPEGVTTSRHHVEVELAGRLTRGRTVVDLRDDAASAGDRRRGTVDVALDVDAARYRDLFVTTLLDGA